MKIIIIRQYVQRRMRYSEDKDNDTIKHCIVRTNGAGKSAVFGYYSSRYVYVELQTQRLKCISYFRAMSD